MFANPGAIILHSSAAGIMAYGYQNLSGLAIHAWIHRQKGGHLQFLTNQGLAIAFATMAFALAVDLFPSFTPFRTIKRAIFMVSLPVAVVVSTVYWSLIFICPGLVLLKDPLYTTPSSSEVAPRLLRLPLSIDLALHATPALTLLADFVFFEKKYSKNTARYGAPLAVALAGLGYASLVEYWASFNGAFPYPFLTDNPFEIRVVIYMGATILALVSFWAINGLHR